MATAIATLLSQASADCQADEPIRLSCSTKRSSRARMPWPRHVMMPNRLKPPWMIRRPTKVAPSVKEQFGHYVYRLRQAENAVYRSSPVPRRLRHAGGAASVLLPHWSQRNWQDAPLPRRSQSGIAGRTPSSRPVRWPLWRRSDLWASFCEQLGLPPLGAEILLGAMEAAAEASGLTVVASS